MSTAPDLNTGVHDTNTESIAAQLAILPPPYLWLVLWAQSVTKDDITAKNRPHFLYRSLNHIFYFTATSLLKQFTEKIIQHTISNPLIEIGTLYYKTQIYLCFFWSSLFGSLLSVVAMSNVTFFTLQAHIEACISQVCGSSSDISLLQYD